LTLNLSTVGLIFIAELPDTTAMAAGGPAVVRDSAKGLTQ